MSGALAGIRLSSSALESNLALLRATTDAPADLSADSWGHGVGALAALVEAGERVVSVSRGSDVALLASEAERLGVTVLRHTPGSPAPTGSLGPALFGLGGALDGLRPVLTLTARLVRRKSIDAGEGVSYGHTWVSEAPAELALIGIGYSDGIDRAAGNRVSVAVRGEARPVVGRVAMNVAVVHLGDAGAPGAALSAELGEDVVLFGDGDSGGGLPTAADWARALGTTPAAITARLSSRIPRRWVS